MITTRDVLIAAMLAASAGCLYVTRLDRSPVYLAHDEVKFALQAHAVATTGRDISGAFLPLYFTEPEFSAGRDPISIYVTALFLKILPLSETAIRLPSAIVGVVNVVLMFVLALRVFKRRSLAIVAATLLALTPAHFLYSRFGMDVQYPLAFVMGWMLCLLAYLETDSLLNLFAGMVCLGLGVYSYLAFLVMMPAYAVFTAVIIGRRRPGRPHLVAAIGLALTLLPLVLWHLGHSGRYVDLLAAYRVTDPSFAPRLGVRPDVYWNFFNPSFLFFSGDSSLVNSTRLAGVFLLPVAILLPLGIRQILTTGRSPFNVLLVWGLVSAPLAAVLLAEVAIRRALVMLPFALLIATFGVECLAQAPGKLARLAAVLLVLALPLQFTLFYQDYFGDYRVRSGPWFGGNIRDGVLEIITRARDVPVPAIYLSTGIPYVDAYWNFYAIKEGRTDLTRRTIYYDPGRLDLETVPAGAVVLSAITEASAGTPPPGGLRPLKVIVEPNGSPSFSLFEK